VPASCHICRHPVSAIDRRGVDTSAHPVGGRPRLGKGWALFGIRPASSSARRNSISMWAFKLRNSSPAQRVSASWTAGSIRSSTCLRSLTDYE
jgi:hypothetical protein